jgi:hypothetical protein
MAGHSLSTSLGAIAADCGPGRWRESPSLVCEIKPVTEGGFGQTTAELNAARAVNLVPRIVAAEPGCRSVLDFPAAVGST